MTRSVSEVDDLLAEEFPPLSPRPAADLLPPGVDEPAPSDGGPGLGSLLGGAGGGSARPGRAAWWPWSHSRGTARAPTPQ